MRKPIKVFYSTLSGRFYASNAYRQNKDGSFTVTGQKDDVTNDIGAAVTEYEIEFTPVEPKPKPEKRSVRIQRLPGDTVKTKSEF